MRTSSKFILLISLFISSCAGMTYGTRYTYTILFEGVKNAPDGLGQITSEEGSPHHFYENDSLLFRLKLNTQYVETEITNKTDRPVYLVLNEAYIVYDGKTSKIVKTGTRVADVDQSIVDEVIASQTRYRGQFFSRNSIRNNNVGEILPSADYNNESIKKSILTSKGKKIRVGIPIRYSNDKKSLYEFWFNVEDVKQVYRHINEER